MMNHLMIDLETLDRQPTSVILSIGAVEFDLETGETGREFYKLIDLTDSLRRGFTVGAGTLMWWMQQDQKARDLISQTEDVSYFVPSALEALSDFIEDTGEDYYVWGNSPVFDLAKLQYHFHKVGLPIPWDFRKERCVRTLVSFKPEIKANMKFEGIKHNPIDDCKHQIKYCSKIWKTLNK